MKITCQLFTFLIIFVIDALAHTNALPHVHPHPPESGAWVFAFIVGGLVLVSMLIRFARPRIYFRKLLKGNRFFSKNR